MFIYWMNNLLVAIIGPVSNFSFVKLTETLFFSPLFIFLLNQICRQKISFVNIISIWCLCMPGDWCLTHWGRVTHIGVSKLTINGSDNGLSPGRRQAIIWTNAGILLIGPVGTNFIEILIEICTFSLKKNALENIVCEMAAMLSRPQCFNWLSITNDCYLYIFIAHKWCGPVRVYYSIGSS